MEYWRISLQRQKDWVLTKNREYDILEEATPWASSALAAPANSGHAAVAAVSALQKFITSQFIMVMVWCWERKLTYQL